MCQPLPKYSVPLLLHCFYHDAKVSEIIRLASQIATQNCLGGCAKLNLGSKFHVSSPTYKIKNTLYLEYYTIVIAAQLLQTATIIHDLSSNFH